ncbi:hypothetical protein QT327_28025 [Olivibacter sp. 47]|jgi:transposase-like protein|uniref:hypothetical protein n=2 Tax=Olivibacter TaxID=376469 RepID=UPI0025A4B1A1|nr:hypothetical protein [Olivibacter sp. 47]MDM8178163.1 hypothetical protein [Olivibacter sp. 47]
METKEVEIIFTERTSKYQKYDRRLIDRVVELSVQGVPTRDLIRQYGMSADTLRDWMHRYGPVTCKRKSYTPAEKRSVVRAIEAGMGVRQALVSFNISYPSVIRRWMKEFKEENADLSVIKPIVEVSKKKTDPSESAEVQALKKALEAANLKIRALNTMIDIAEDRLKIDIRKKSGARQSSK